ncbi:MAG: M20/M25/M40 family metallo-hydrolase [Nitrososphaera sp.]|jgi:acetylornithine deacetylase/succinyl-diaminopimelate desuccinylase-like protein
MNKILKHVDKNMSGLVSDLQVLIRQPSVSAKNQGIEQCATLVSRILKKSGISSEILRLKGVAPLVYGEVKSKKNPSKTLLFYNHYDVQPAEPLELWDDDPFSGKVKGNKIFGRGSADDKGELITRIKAVEAFLKETGDVPCNIKFVIEGEEEIGSANIGRYLEKFKKKFTCDAVIWEFGYVDSKNRPIIGLGMKGLLYVELSAKEAVRDAHSSLAVIIKNPAWRLIEALKTLRDDSGRILIKDWYKEVVPFTKSDIELLRREPFDERGFKAEYGIREFVNAKRGLEVKKALAGDPTCNIAGLVAGYTTEGAKTVLPASALVKIDFRLVPKMDPKRQLARLKKHLKQKGFADIKVKVFHGEAAARTDPNDPFVAQVQDAAKRIFGDYIINVSNAGTGPMHSFVNILKAPCISIGSTYMFARIHSPNEFARIDLLKKTTKCMCMIINNFAMHA